MKPQRASHGMLWLIVSGILDTGMLYFIHILVAKSLGSHEYGLFGLLMSVILWVRTLMSAGILTALTKFLPDITYSQKDVFRKGFRLQVLFSLCAIILILAFAKPLADYLNEPIFIPCFMILAAHTFFYAFLTYILTGQQALRLFRESTVNIFLYAAARLLCVTLAVMLGAKIFGICLAYVAAIIATGFFLIPSLVDLRKHLTHEKSRTPISYRYFLHFSGYQLGFILLLNLMPVLNLILTKRFVPDMDWIGYYVAVATLAKAPNLIIGRGLFTVILPIMSAAQSKNNQALVFHYSRQALKLLLIFFVPFAAILTVTGKELLSFIFKPDFALIYKELNIYYGGVFFLSMVHLFTFFLYTKGEIKSPFLTMLGIAIFQGAVLFTTLPSLGVLGAAWAFLLSGAVGFALFLKLFRKEFRYALPWMETLKIIGVGVISGWVLAKIPGEEWLLIPRYTLMGLVYFNGLYLLRVITRDDLASFTGKHIASPAPLSAMDTDSN